MQSLLVRLVRENAQPPTRMRTHDAAYDLSCCEDFVLEAGERKIIATGVAVALPDGVCGLLLPRSGLAAKHGITVVNSPGLIDPSYRGEIMVAMLNTSALAFFASEGDRVAQLLLTPFGAPEVEVVSELPESADGRGDGGFGSSGR